MTITHRKTGSAVYIVWKNMKARCENPKHTAYKNYGQRGIKVCAEWASFEAFYKDMGDPPYGLSLERSNNALGYYKENCLWADASQQNRNKRTPLNNKSGLKGVHWCAAKFLWVVKVPTGRKNSSALLQTKDFFEACCARKSWEARRVR